MKKIIFGLLSLLLISPIFADSLGPVVYNASGSRLYISYGYNYSNIYRLPNYNRCGETQFFGIGNYSDYLIGSFNFTGSSDTVSYGNTGNYVYGYNNGFFLNNNITTSLSFYGSIYKTGLACTSNTPIYGNFSYFSFGFDSSNNLHNIVYFPNFGYRIGANRSLISSPGVLLYSSNSLLASSSVNTGFNNFVYIDSNRNVVFYFDDYRLYSNYGSFNDIPDGFQRKKFLVNGDFTYSSIYSLSGNYDFLSVVDSGIIIYGGDFPSFSVSPNYGYFLFHIVDYSSGYYAGSPSTFILSKSGSSIIYNAYNVFSNDINELISLTPVRKGYLTGDFNSFVNSNGQYFEVYGTYSNGITFRLYDFDTNSLYSNFSFSFIEDSTVFVIDLVGSNSNPSLTTGSVVDILDTLCNSSFVKPIFCNGVDQVSTGVDGFWDLDGSGNLIYTLINTDPNNMGWGDITPDGSGGFNITCSDQDGFGCPLLENAGLSGYLDYGSGFILGTDYYETFFQKTGRFFTCPYGYVVLDTNSFLKILNKFNQISESIGFDFMLPINCSIAAFTHGKNYKFLKDVDIGLNPLMGQIQGPDDPRVSLYRFFDFLMSIALLFFLLKFYHLIF